MGYGQAKMSCKLENLALGDGLTHADQLKQFACGFAHGTYIIPMVDSVNVLF
jgi:hypothetical protein